MMPPLGGGKHLKSPPAPITVRNPCLVGDSEASGDWEAAGDGVGAGGDKVGRGGESATKPVHELWRLGINSPQEFLRKRQPPSPNHQDITHMSANVPRPWKERQALHIENIISKGQAKSIDQTWPATGVHSDL